MSSQGEVLTIEAHDFLYRAPGEVIERVTAVSDSVYVGYAASPVS